MKVCSACKIEKEDHEFYKHSKTSFGLSSQCKKCDSNGRRLKSLEKKKKLVDLMGGSCKICGYNKCLQALEFHHFDENKDHSISDLMKRSFKFSLKEITKCVLLCSNCHRELHSEMKFPIEYNGKVKSIK